LPVPAGVRVGVALKAPKAENGCGAPYVTLGPNPDNTALALRPRAGRRGQEGVAR